MGSRSAAGWAIALGLLAGAGTEARADSGGGPGLSLEWSAAEGCPDGAAARAAIAHYAGVIALDPANPVMVRVEVAPGDAGDWRGRVELHGPDGQGEREFRGPSCEQVAQAATLIVAIMLDPLKTAATVRASDGRDRSAPALAAPPAEGARLELGFETSGDIGSLPSATVGVGLEGGVRAGLALLQAQATYWLPERAVRGPRVASGGQMGLYSGGLRGCLDAVRTRADRFRLGLCLHGELGVATGTGFGLDQTERSFALWGAAFAGVSAQLSGDPLATWLSVEVGTPLVRPVYEIDGFGDVFRASPVLLRASCGVAWDFR